MCRYCLVMKYSSGCVRMENKPYKIRYTPLAYDDLADISRYISEVLANHAAADRLMSKMEKNINQLTDFPYSGSEVRDNYLASKGYRKLVVDNYLVFYIVSDEQQMIVVMRVIYGAREYQNLL